MTKRESAHTDFIATGKALPLITLDNAIALRIHKAIAPMLITRVIGNITLSAVTILLPAQFVVQFPSHRKLKHHLFILRNF